MADPKWKERLIPVLPDAVSALACIITEDLMDKLCSKRVLISSTYDEMIERIDSDGIYKSKSARTLFRILMRCPPPSFDAFCSTLEEIEGGDTLLKLLASSFGHNTEEKLGDCGEPRSVIATPRTSMQPYVSHRKRLHPGSSRIPRLKRLSQIEQASPKSPKTLMEPLGSSESKASLKHSDSGVSEEAIGTGVSSLDKVIVHVDKALEKEFEPYQGNVEAIIRDLIETKTKIIEVTFRFIDGIPINLPRRQKMGKGEPSIEIPLQCELRIYLPNIDEKCFLERKASLFRMIHSLLGYKNIEILHGSCDVFLTLRGIDFIRFISDLRNSRVLISFIQLDTDTEIQLCNLKSIKVTHLLRQSSLLPVAESLSTIQQQKKIEKRFFEVVVFHRCFLPLML